MVEDERVRYPDLKPVVGHVVHLSVMQDGRLLLLQKPIGEHGLAFELPSHLQKTGEEASVLAVQMALGLGISITSPLVLLGTFQKVAPHRGQLKDGRRSFFSISGQLPRNFFVKNPHYCLFSEADIRQFEPSVFYRPVIKQAALQHLQVNKQGYQQVAPFRAVEHDTSDVTLAAAYEAYLASHPYTWMQVT